MDDPTQFSDWRTAAHRAGGARASAESVWQAAQRVLHAHRGGRACSASQPYLWRGLIHCGLCGLLYSGMRQRGPQPGHSYRCNGRQFAHALYGDSNGNSGNGIPFSIAAIRS